MPKRQLDTPQDTGDVPITELQERFGTNFRQARLSAGLTQVQVSELSGINQSDLSKIERGAVNLTLGTMQRLATIVAADVSNLLSSKPIRTPTK